MTSKTALQGWARIAYSVASAQGLMAGSEKSFVREWDAQYEGIPFHSFHLMPSMDKAYFWWRVGFRRCSRKPCVR